MDLLNQIIQGDCLEVMKDLPDNCIDSIMAVRRINEAETGVSVAEQKAGQMGLFEK